MEPAALKRLRKRLNLTQRDLAEMLGCTWQTVSGWENGHTQPMEVFVRALETLKRKEGKTR